MQGICQRKKIPAARKFPSPPITFLMVRPLDNDNSSQVIAKYAHLMFQKRKQILSQKSN